MTPEQNIIAFMKKKAEQWGPNPLAYVQQLGVEGLTQEFAQDPDLSQFRGWFRRPSDDQITGSIEQFIREANPVLGIVVSIIVRALIDACAQRHKLNKAVANDNINTGVAVASVASLFLGAIMILDNLFGQDS